MARYLFVSDPLLSSIALVGTPNVAQLAAGQLFQLYTDRAGGNLVTDVVATDGITALPQTNGWFTADGTGQPPDLRGPNGTVVLWIDAGAGRRYPIFAADLLAQVLAAGIQWLVNGVGSGTSTGTGGVTDHGALSGLGDDDHTQYLTSGRGDARYYTQAQVDQKTAAAATASSTDDRDRSKHFGTQSASSISDLAAAVVALLGGDVAGFRVYMTQQTAAQLTAAGVPNKTVVLTAQTS